MGKRIRQRTPQEQEIYDKIIDRLLAGESPTDLSAETGVDRGKLANWVWRERKKRKKELAKKSNALTYYTESTAQQRLSRKALEISESIQVTDNTSESQAVSEETRQRNDELGDNLKNLLLEQALITVPSLISLRGEVEGSLQDSHFSFSQLFQQLRSILERGGISVISYDELGERIETVEPLTIGQISQLSKILKESTKAFADLHLIPHGAMRTAPIRFGDSIPPQHLHLHSHGGKRSNPDAIDTISPIKDESSSDIVVDAEYSSMESEICSEQDDLLARM